MPGPNMILMMSFLGLKVGGIPGAIASALATFGPPCAMYYLAYRLWDRFRDMPWQRIVRRGLAPLTIGLVIAGGYVMARAAAVGWQSVAITAAAATLMLGTRLNPLWILAAGGVIGGVGTLLRRARPVKASANEWIGDFGKHQMIDFASITEAARDPLVIILGLFILGGVATYL